MVYFVEDETDLSTQIIEALDNPVVVGFINPDRVGSDMSRVMSKVDDLDNCFPEVRFILAVVDDTTDIGQSMKVDPSPFHNISSDFFYV